MLRPLAVLAALLAAPHAGAASYDPQMKWRTITTEHFDIHFHQGEEQLAEELSQVVEDVYDTQTAELRWEPRARTQVVIVDRTDYANGYASTLPYNQIVLYATAPTDDSTLNLYEHWNTSLFTHELTHILHLDTNHGIVRAVRIPLGRVVSTNDLSPLWMIEGFATFQETRQTTGGRGRASWPDMIKRTAVVEDAFPPLGNLDGFQPFPPGGNLRYLFGQDFIQWVADHQGEDTWTRWVHFYGSQVPYVLELPPIDKDKPMFASRRSFDRALTSMYFDWRDDAFAKYTAQADAVRARGETIGRLVSGGDASCVAPSFSPDGDWLVWSCYDLKTGSAIWRADGEGYAREVLLQDRGATNFTWRGDSKAFVYAGVHLVNRFNTWSDIYLHRMGSEGAVALTQAARARDPEFSPDGSRLLYVTNKAQQNQLEFATVDQQKHTLTANDDHTQYSTPRYSPDGRSVALSVWADGRRDLWLYSPEGKPLRRITQDAAIDADPAWSRDGKTLYFTSDRSGIPNVYAIDIETEALFQVTNVVTGATRVTVHPNGTRIAYQQYSQDGWDIMVLDVDREKWFPLGHLPQPVRYATPIRELTGPAQAPIAEAVAAAWDRAGTPVDTPRFGPIARAAIDVSIGQSPPGESIDSFDDADVNDLYGEEADYPFTITPHRYNPFPLLRPRFISPYLQTTTEPWDASWGPVPTWAPALLGTLSTGSSDPLRHFGWSAWGTFRTDVNAFGGGGSMTLNRFLPVYNLSGSTRALSRGRVPLVDPENPVDETGALIIDRESGPTYWERRQELYATVSWPYKLRTTLFANYAFTDRETVGDLPADAWEPEIPLRGRTGSLSAGWRYAWAQQTALAISLEDARIFSLVGSVMHPWLGTAVVQEDGELGPLSQVQLGSEIREYVVTPWLPNHVIAGRAGVGVTFGATEFLGNYLLGGNYGDGAYYVSPDGAVMLRGFPFGVDIGDMYWTANLEYRLPLWYIQRGIGVIPAYARNLSGSVFVDTGNAFNSPIQSGRAGTAAELADAAIADPHVGVGAELQLSGVIGWGIGLNGRIGYGFALTPGGYPLGSPDGLYFQFGGSF